MIQQAARCCPKAGLRVRRAYIVRQVVAVVHSMPVFDGNRPLLEAFRTGCRHALHTVYAAYFDDVVAVLRGGTTLTGSRVAGVGADDEALHDLVQTVFLKAFAEKARLAFDGLRPYGPYIRQIARHALADYQRARGREAARRVDLAASDGGGSDDGAALADNHWEASALAVEAASDWGSGSGPSDGSDAPETLRSQPAEARLDWARMTAVTRDVVATLSDEQQQYVRLRFEEELGQAAVAEAMGVTRRRIRTLEGQVFKALRLIMRKRGWVG